MRKNRKINYCPGGSQNLFRTGIHLLPGAGGRYHRCVAQDLPPCHPLNPVRVVLLIVSHHSQIQYGNLASRKGIGIPQKVQSQASVLLRLERHHILQAQPRWQHESPGNTSHTIFWQGASIISQPLSYHNCYISDCIHNCEFVVSP